MSIKNTDQLNVYQCIVLPMLLIERCSNTLFYQLIINPRNNLYLSAYVLGACVFIDSLIRIWTYNLMMAAPNG